MSKVIYVFDSEDDQFEIELLQISKKMFNALHDIEQICNTQMKYGQEELSDHIYNLLEKIREECLILNQDD